MLAIFQVPNKFFEADGRVVDAAGQDWDEIWGHTKRADVGWSEPAGMRWIALAAVPSGLVIAVTAYLTTDIAAAPFPWVAPQIFNGNYEYPIVIALALLCTPGLFSGGLRKALTGALPWLAISAALALVWTITRYQPPATLELPFQGLLALLAAPMLFQRQHPMRFFGLVILSFAVTALWRPGIAPIETARSFFGVHKVAERRAPDAGSINRPL